eukprot:977573-Rhodomonas_salina.1
MTSQLAIIPGARLPSRAAKFTETLVMASEAAKVISTLGNSTQALRQELCELDKNLRSIPATAPLAADYMARAAFLRTKIEQESRQISNIREMVYSIIRDTFNEDAVTPVDPTAADAANQGGNTHQLATHGQ